MQDSSPISPISQAPHAGAFADDILNRMSPAADGVASIEVDDLCPAPRELPCNHMLNGYRIERCVGAGGFGVTYLAADALLGRRVVIKEHFPKLLCERRCGALNVELTDPAKKEDLEWSRRNFLREMRLMATLDHHNIVKIFSSFTAHQTLYYVTEYIDGRSLGDLTQYHRQAGTRITQDELYGLMVRLLDALHYLHSRSILHLDIKPDNILLTSNGRPVMIDFGAAHENFGDTGAGVVETVGFSPPEQSLEGGERLGPWSDIYALGATLCYLLTGYAPSPGGQRLLYDNFEPLASRAALTSVYHTDLLAGIDRALSPTLDARYRSVDEWMADLREP